MNSSSNTFNKKNKLHLKSINPSSNKNSIINNINTNSNQPKEKQKGNGLAKLATWITIISGLIAIYYFYQDELKEFFTGSKPINIEVVE